MKKAIAIIVSVLCLLLSACSTASDPTDTTGIVYVDIEYGGIYAVQLTVQEYNEYLEEYCKLLPENFVHYDKLSEIGRFMLFAPSLDFPHSYNYTVLDRNKEIYITITHSTDDNSISTEEYVFMTDTSEMSSMLMAPRTEDTTLRVLLRNGWEYRYAHNGALLNVARISDGVEIEISGWQRLVETNVSMGTKNPILKGILSIDDEQASAALNQLGQLLDTE